METTRQTILDHASRIAVSQGEIPSFNALADSVGISKGGLMHHFPTRQSLLIAIVVDAIGEVDEALDQASGKTEFLRTWLKLSIPDPQGITLFQSMAAVFFAGKSETGEIQSLVVEVSQRWENRLKKELGNAKAARAAQLVGDGLLFGAITGTITDKNAATYLRTAEEAVGTFIQVSQ
jgi:AcrR family transcriptional regulator